MLLCESELMRESGCVVVLIVALCRFFFPVLPLWMAGMIERILMGVFFWG